MALGMGVDLRGGGAGVWLRAFIAAPTDEMTMMPIASQCTAGSLSPSRSRPIRAPMAGSALSSVPNVFDGSRCKARISSA